MGNYQVQFKIRPETEFEQYIEDATLEGISDLISINEGGIHSNNLIVTALRYDCVTCEKEKNIEVHDGHADISHTICHECEQDVCPDCRVFDTHHKEYGCPECIEEKA